MATPTKTKKWGDAEFEDNDVSDLDLPQSYETEPDENGVKTVVEYKTKSDGSRVKVIKKVKIRQQNTRVNKRIAERKKWAKFGDCTGLPDGPEQGITNLGDEVVLERVKDKAEKKQAAKPASSSSVVTCRRCGMQGDHWTVACPYKDRLPREDLAVPSASASSGAPGGGTDGPKKWTIPAKRLGGRTEGDSMMKKRDDTSTIRVTNLSEDTTEQDLTDLFRKYGDVSRVFLARDKATQYSKGFAFVSFYSRDDAERAMKKLAGVGFDHVILHLEWAKPSTRD